MSEHLHSGSRAVRVSLASRAKACVLVLGLAAGCVSSGGEDGGAGPHPGQHAPPVVLVSLDGFRWDYLDRGVTPNLARLESSGVRAEALVPSFPTKTFPNHYTMVTGLYPDHHGIVSNNFWDPVFGERFSMFDREKVGDARWWGGVPVWITAERAGIPTAPLFWPGSEAAIGGIRPGHWLPYDGSMSHEARVEWILSKLELPEEERPGLLTLYFSDTDEVGHRVDPDTPEVNGAIRAADRAVGLLLDGLEARGPSGGVNVLVVSDHGMAAIRKDQVIFVDDYVDLATVEVADWNPVLALWPHDGEDAAVYEALDGAHPHMHVYRRDEFPPAWHYGTNRRVAPITGVADPGWSITTRSTYEAEPERFAGGNHGFDSTFRDMYGIFVASGPDFRSGIRVAPIENVDVYPLLMRLMQLAASPSDGDLDRVSGLLAP